jgi:hypothetical protein
MVSSKQQAYQNFKKELELLQTHLATIQQQILQAHRLVQTAQQFASLSASM